MPDLSDLISRVEKASDGDRELDAEIAIAMFEAVTSADDIVYARRRNPGQDATHPGHYFVVSRSGAQAAPAPAYTTSIDAALTVLPEGYKWKCGYSRHVPHNAEIVDYSAHTGMFIGESDVSRCLALLSAILRARQAMQVEAAS